jgi:rod shape-determining protein MreC
MRGQFTKKRVIAGAVVVLFVLSLNFFASEVRGFVYSVSSSFQAVLWDAGNGISNFFGGGQLKIENDRLRRENFTLRGTRAELDETRKENEELRKALDIELKEDFTFVFADIIGKNIGEDVAILRGGADLGIKVGMPVITAEKAVVGKVEEVLLAQSKVRLISHKESRFDAKIPGEDITGVVRGQGGQKIMLDLIPQEAELHKGDMIITSNLGDIFPEDLLVGEITEILKTGADPFQKASVKPFFDLGATESLFIITN